MIIETYQAILRHDTGTVQLKVVSLSEEQGAIQQMTAAEGCPESAITQLKQLHSKTILPTNNHFDNPSNYTV